LKLVASEYKYSASVFAYEEVEEGIDQSKVIGTSVYIDFAAQMQCRSLRFLWQ
jgi:hypothetical protein